MVLNSSSTGIYLFIDQMGGINVESAYNLLDPTANNKTDNQTRFPILTSTATELNPSTGEPPTTVQPLWFLVPESDNTLTTLCFYLIPVVGSLVFILNAGVFVPCVYTLKKKSSRRHQQIYNSNRTALMYVANLTISDALLGIDAALAYVLTSSSQHMCLLKHASTISLSVVSIVSILLIGVDRYLYIDHPLHYLQWMTTGRIKLAIGLSWCTGFLFGVTPLFWHASEWKGHCFYADVMSPGFIFMTGLFYIGGILVPLTLLYIRIFYCAHVQRKRIRELHTLGGAFPPLKQQIKAGLLTPKTQSEVEVLFGAHGKFFQRKLSQKKSCGHTPNPNGQDEQLCPPPATTNRILRRIHRLGNAMRETRLISELRSAKVVLLILGSCSFTWLPFVIAGFIHSFHYCDDWCYSLSLSLTSTFFFLGLLNSILDPFIYAWGFTEFQDFWKDMCCRCFRLGRRENSRRNSRVPSSSSLGISRFNTPISMTSRV